MDCKNMLAQTFPNVKKVGFKVCGKCKGQMGLSTDPDAGLVWECIQCGHEEYIKSPSENLQKVHSWELK